MSETKINQEGLGDALEAIAEQPKTPPRRNRKAIKTVSDAGRAADESMLAGVGRPARETKTPARKTRTPKANGTAPAKPARTAPAPKAADPKETAPKANGTDSKRGTTREWARKVATVLAEAFADDSDEAKAKVAYWIHGLPYGGADGSNAGGKGRWFPEGLPRPTTADWR